MASASALADVAWAVTGSGKLDEAESVEREALAMQRKLLGDEAPAVAKSLNYLGQLLARQGNLPESDAVLRMAITNQNKLLGEDNPISLDTLRNLGLVLEAEGKWAEAEHVHREAVAIWHKRGDNETSQVLSELQSLAGVLMAQKKFDDAEQLLDEILTPALVRQPCSGDLVALRADLKARRGQWQEAATDATLAFELQPLKDERYAMVAALQVRAQSLSTYEKFPQPSSGNIRQHYQHLRR